MYIESIYGIWIGSYLLSKDTNIIKVHPFTTDMNS